uniref:Uncharacterized protein n=1 Tax=Arundo donax TaxID=35708 RepID=A0A0A8YGK0_ARUDO
MASSPAVHMASSTMLNTPIGLHLTP